MAIRNQAYLRNSSKRNTAVALESFYITLAIGSGILFGPSRLSLGISLGLVQLGPLAIMRVFEIFLF